MDTRQLLILIACVAWCNCAIVKKKILEEGSKISKPEKLATDEKPPAILAIEIVDSDDNSTDARKNTKRTIESALGYGYQNGLLSSNHGKKFMVYPYSQYDIPPSSYRKPGHGQANFNLQKSISYTLGSVKTKPVVEHQPQYIQPAAGYYPSTLFSTVQGGHVGGLSTHLSAPGYHGQSVPVIILRVYTNQLANPGAAIYPNLPQSHPYATNLNSLNLQALLSQYVQQYQQKLQQKYQQQFQQQYQQQLQQYQYQQPHASYYQQQYQQEYQPQYQQEYQYQDKYEAPKEYQYQQQYQSQAAYENPSLPTSENYPDDAHTRVIFHHPKGLYQSVGQASLHKNLEAVQGADKYVGQEPTTKYTQTETQADQGYVYVTPEASNAEHAQEQYYQPDYQQYQEEPNTHTVQKTYYLPSVDSDKHYNYHAQSSGDRSKKSSGSPVKFESEDAKAKQKS